MLPTVRISLADAEAIREYVRANGLWFALSEPPPRLEPHLERFGFQLVERDDMAHLGMYGLIGRGRASNVLYVASQISGPTRRSVLAATLAYAVLGHTHPLVEILPGDGEAMRRIDVPQDVVETLRAAGSLIMIPENFVTSALSVDEIAAYCHCPGFSVQRRLYGIAIGTAAHSVIRFDRRKRDRLWGDPAGTRRSGTDSLTLG